MELHRRPGRGLVRAVTAGALLVVAGLAVWGCGDGDPGGAYGIRVASSTATPTAERDIATLELALRLEQEGRVEEALWLLGQLAGEAEAEVRQEALYQLGRIQYLAGNRTEAATVLEAYVASAPGGSGAQRGLYVLARLREEQGDGTDAIALYRRYAEAGGPLEALAWFRLGVLLAGAANWRDAELALQNALGSGLTREDEADAMLAIAAAHEQRGDLAGARSWYERVYLSSPSQADKALALRQIGVLSRRLGDRERWRESSQTLVRTFPAFTVADQALGDLREEGEAVDPLVEAAVHREHGRLTQAQSLLLEIVHSGTNLPEAAEAAYRLGEMSGARGDAEEALGWYQESLRLAPEGPLAPAAAWARARQLERLERPAEASDAYADAFRRYPSSPQGMEAAFRLGLDSWDAGEEEQAAGWWQGMAAAAGAVDNSEQQARALYWSGRALAAVGQRALAAEAYAEAAAADPGGFYSLRAEAALSAQRSGAAAALFSEGEAAAWLESWAGPRPRGADATASAEWQLGRELWAMGLRREGTPVLVDALRRHREQPWDLLAMASHAHDLGIADVAAPAATLLLAQAEEAGATVAPTEVGRLAYPRPYEALVSGWARAWGLDPLLLYALMRQESFFDPDATSVADARGLTQVIPSTGFDVARQLGREGFKADLLLRPTVSVEFGAYYLSRQLENFDGGYGQALAAYNAGPGRAAGWQEESAGDPDRFVEAIDVQETSDYVKRVMEHYARYQALYGEERLRSP